jgi:hypothetical protein
MNPSRTDPDEDDAPPARAGVSRALLAILALVGAGAIAYGTWSIGLWGGPSEEEIARRTAEQQALQAAAREERAQAAAARNANAPMLQAAPTAVARPGSAASASAVLPQVSLLNETEMRFSRPAPSRVMVLSISSVGFGNAQRMLQFAVRVYNDGKEPLAFRASEYRLVTDSQSLAPMDRFEEAVAPGASADGLVSFVAGAADTVRALRLVQGGEQKDLPLTQ